MQRLTERDLDALLSCLREIYAELDFEGFVACLVKTLPKVLASELTSYTEVDLRSYKIVAPVREPVSDVAGALMPTLERHLHEHPPFRHYQQTHDGWPLKISDFVTQSQFHQLELYNEFYKRLGLEHELSTILPSRPPFLGVITLDRGGKEDFSERDRLFLDLLRPHLMQAYRNAVSSTRLRQDLAQYGRALEESDRGIVFLTEENLVLFYTKKARKWISECFEPSRRADHLPEDLQRWIEHQRSLVSQNGDIPSPRQPLVLERPGKRLVVRLVDDGPDKEYRRLLVLEEQTLPFSAGSLESLGLTPREAEVLAWVSRGKTDKEVSGLLYISPRTVKKHLQHVYEKLGVESRAKATIRAQEFLGPLRG